MHLILLRHAEKDLGGGSDPDLSPWGAMQAASLCELLTKNEAWPKPTKVVASPKIRAQATTAPLAATLGLALDIRAELDERRGDESGAEFRDRVRGFLAEFESGASPSDCVVWCTHLDWIEEFRTLVDSDRDLVQPKYLNWSPSAFMVFHLDDLWTVVEFGRAM